LSRWVDPETGNLHTERLLTCKQGAPEFIMKLIGGQATSYVLERSVVDWRGRSLELRSTNMTFSHLLVVEETCRYEPIPGDKPATEWTKFTQEAQVTSLSAWSSIRDYLEEFSVSRFQANAHKGRNALEQVIKDLFHDTKQLLSSKFGDEWAHIRDIGRSPETKQAAMEMAVEAIVEQE
jgi:hypothetical protein